MLGLNQMKKLMYLAVFLVSLSFTSFAQGNAEISAHFGMKFGSKLNLQEITTDNQDSTLGIDQKNMPLHFGADALYRHMMNDTGSFGVGLRYRFAFTGEKDFDATSSADTSGIRDDENDKYKFTHHRVALLANYRFHIGQFFVGPVIGIDIWKSLKFSVTGLGATTGHSYEFTSNQFLWNQITGQAGLELGYKVTDNLLAKLEIGYDLSSFSNLKCKMATGDNDLTECAAGGNHPLEMEGTGEDAESKNAFKLGGFYATLGIGWFFG